MLDVDFDSTRGNVSIVLDVSFDRARSMVLLCLRYVSSTVLEVCFGGARGLFRPRSRYASNSREVSTVLDIYFDRAPDIFQLCPRHVSTVHELGFNVLEICFDHARGMF